MNGLEVALVIESLRRDACALGHGEVDELLADAALLAVAHEQETSASHRGHFEHEQPRERG